MTTSESCLTTLHSVQPDNIHHKVSVKLARLVLKPLNLSIWAFPITRSYMRSSTRTVTKSYIHSSTRTVTKSYTHNAMTTMLYNYSTLTVTRSYIHSSTWTVISSHTCQQSSHHTATVCWQSSGHTTTMFPQKSNQEWVFRILVI